MIQTGSMVLRGGTRMLTKAIGDAAPRDARLLMAHVLGVPMDRLTLELARAMTPAQVAQFESLIKRRIAREPVSRIIGARLFWGRRFEVTGDVLDPRPETECLIEEALRTPAARVLDIGTGSGCILVTLLAEWPEARGVGTDISAAALEVAERNAQAAGTADRVALTCTDWAGGVEGRFDLIVSNPPYIAAAEMSALADEVRNHDPEIALAPGGDGLDAYRAIAEQAMGLLTPEGRLIVEIGPTQAGAVRRLFAAQGLVNIHLLTDLDGRDRVVAARKE